MDDHSSPVPNDKAHGADDGSLDRQLLPLHWQERLQAKNLLASNEFRDTLQAIVEEEGQEREKKFSDFAREDEEREAAQLGEEFGKLEKAYQAILQRALSAELDVQSLSSVLLDQKDYLGSMPTLKPTNGWYTSGFGARTSPFTGKPTMHEGLDIANHFGSNILVPAAGIITYAGIRAGYGNLITVDHGYGIQTQYGHISRFYVHTGEKVKRGQRLAAIGSTGRSTGPHVHYEVRVNGIPVDPYYYILED